MQGVFLKKEKLLTQEKQRDLLAFVWYNRLFDATKLAGRDGIRVEVISPGTPDPHNRHIFRSVELIYDNCRYVANAAVHLSSSEWGTLSRNNDKTYDDIMLNIVCNDDRITYKIDGKQLLSIKLCIPKNIESACARLSGVEKFCGAEALRMMTAIELRNHMTRMVAERMQRKYGDIMETFRSVGNDWQETFYIELFGAASRGNKDDKHRYKSLARNIPYSKLCKELASPKAVEAMLFGAAGQLESNYYDDYYLELQSLFDVLRHKYSIQALRYEVSASGAGRMPFGQFARKLAQIARLLTSNKFNFRSLMECRTAKDAAKLFDLGTHEYWKNHFAFDMESTETRNMIGESVVEGFIINLVAPMMFAYGVCTEDEELKERAMDFLHQVKGEDNRYSRPWIKLGFKPDSGAISQGMVQLASVYCVERDCCRCFIGCAYLKRTHEAKGSNKGIFAKFY